MLFQTPSIQDFLLPCLMIKQGYPMYSNKPSTLMVSPFSTSSEWRVSVLQLLSPFGTARDCSQWVNRLAKSTFLCGEKSWFAFGSPGKTNPSGICKLKERPQVSTLKKGGYEIPRLVGFIPAHKPQIGGWFIIVDPSVTIYHLLGVVTPSARTSHCHHPKTFQINLKIAHDWNQEQISWFSWSFIRFFGH